MMHSGWGLERGGNENFWHFDKKYFQGKNAIWMGFHSLIWDDLSERVDHSFVNSITVSTVMRKLMSIPLCHSHLSYVLGHKWEIFFNHIYISRERIEIKLQLCISHYLMGKFHSIKGLNLVEVISLLLNTPCTSEKQGSTPLSRNWPKCPKLRNNSHGTRRNHASFQREVSTNISIQLWHL